MLEFNEKPAEHSTPIVRRNHAYRPFFNLYPCLVPLALVEVVVVDVDVVGLVMTSCTVNAPVRVTAICNPKGF